MSAKTDDTDSFTESTESPQIPSVDDEKVKAGKALARQFLSNSKGQSFSGDTHAQAGTMNAAQKAVGVVVGLMVGGLVAAFLLPVAIDEIVNVDTTNWSSGAASMWEIMDVIIVLAVFLFFIGVALAATNRI
jgi:small-conductance mechanosensitive channel